MFLRELTLKNWKSFELAEFRFPEPSKVKPLVLIGALNGAGKTSLMEAVLIGLYGHQGFTASQSLRRGQDDEPQNYSNLIRAALNKKAKRQRDNQMEIRLEYRESGDTLLIVRRWTVGERPTPPKESVELWLNGRQLTTDGDVRDEMLAGEVAKRILPPTALEAFFFDAEQLGRAMGDAGRESFVLRLGQRMEDVIGFRQLGQVDADVRKHLQRLTPREGESSLELTRGKLAAEVSELNERLDAELSELGAAKHRYEAARNAADDIADALRSFPTQTRLKDLIAARAIAETARHRLDQSIAKSLETNLAKALIPAALVQAATEALIAEGALEEWEKSAKSAQAMVRTLTRSAQDRLSKGHAALSAEQVTRVNEWIEDAYKNIIFPRPDACAAQYYYTFATGERRSLLMRELAQLGAGIDEFRSDLQRRSEKQAEEERLSEEIRHAEVTDEELGKLLDKYDIANTRYNQLKNDFDALAARIPDLRAQLETKRQELGRCEDRLTELALGAQEREVCSKVLKACNDIRERLRTQLSPKVSASMTTIYRRLSHKGDVAKIEVNFAGDAAKALKVLDKRGDEITLGEGGRSAGELQLLNMAFIFAVGDMTGGRTGLFIDTPLARLDLEHRKRLLGELCNQATSEKARGFRQVFMLSTDTEVTREELAHVSQSIGARFLLEGRTDPDDNRTTVVRPDAYFQV